MDIVTTVGPASWSNEMLKSFIQLGVHLFRFPFAQETPADHILRCNLVKTIANDLGKHVEAMADLPGGKPRLNNPKSRFVTSDRAYSIAVTNNSEAGADFGLFPTLNLRTLQVPCRVTIGDGENLFDVEEISGSIIIGRFLKASELGPNRAFMPNSGSIEIASFTDQDMAFATLVKKGGFDWIALSFVDSSEDITGTRRWLEVNLGWSPRIIAKVETRNGVERIEEIVDVADGVMIGRGDLAVQVGFSNLWDAVKKIAYTCKIANKYVIVGTGFLEYFSQTGMYSRSEFIDLCATLDLGINGIMLSAETTVGKYPKESVELLIELGKSRGETFELNPGVER